jgi:nucleoside-diphosphate-sugar epimerase
VDFPEIAFRIVRFHNIYGPHGTWCGGREKAPAAFLRKALCSDKEFEMWGDGKQTRSFCYVLTFYRENTFCGEHIIFEMWGDGKQTRSFCYVLT